MGKGVKTAGLLINKKTTAEYVFVVGTAGFISFQLQYLFALENL
jgi:hypothetical protein